MVVVVLVGFFFFLSFIDIKNKDIALELRAQIPLSTVKVLQAQENILRSR